jgi:beta-galactosidase
MSALHPPTDGATRARLAPSGLVLGDETVPLLSGSMDHFRLSRRAWQPALASLKGLGVRLVDVTLPWGIHETARGTFDFGGVNPRLDVVAFLTLAQDAGLLASVRVGPWLSHDLSFGGLPERIVWDERCQARSPSGSPVLVTSLPLAYPKPSLSSRAFNEEAALWLRAVSERLAPLAWPSGPIVLVTIDTEPADLAADPHDYHPDALGQYRRFLRQRYPTLAALRRSYRDPQATFDGLVPPATLETADPDLLAPHLDFHEFQEARLEASFYRFRAALDGSGLGSVTKATTVPGVRTGGAADPERMSRVADLAELDAPRHAAPVVGEEPITALAALSTRRGVPPLATVSAGFSAVERPAAEEDDAFSALAALSCGVRGFRIRMAVQRDRWIGGPIDAHGRARASSEFWSRLTHALERTRFHELSRRTKVRILVPRSVMRLRATCRVLPEPVSAWLGTHPSGSALVEGAHDPTQGGLFDAEQFVTALTETLERLRVPFGFCGTDSLDDALADGAWAIVVSPGALDTKLTAAIGERLLGSGKVSVGPRAPERDALMHPSEARLPSLARPVVPILLPSDSAALAGLVERAVATLGIDVLPVTPECVRTTLHHDAEGRPRVLFVINESHDAVEATAATPGARAAENALTGEPCVVENGYVTVRLRARNAVMLELS